MEHFVDALLFMNGSKWMAHLECWVWQKSSWQAELTPDIHTCHYPGSADILSEIKKICLIYMESFFSQFMTLSLTEETVFEKSVLFKLWKINVAPISMFNCK